MKAELLVRSNNPATSDPFRSLHHGAVPSPRRRYRGGCCCTECLQRAYLGCDGMPPAALRNLEEPVDLLYVDSQIMKPDQDTLANLALFKMNRPDAPNINLRATCCGSVLCTVNQEFHVPYSIMATFNNLRPFLECDFSEVPESKMNLFTKDWPKYDRKALALREKSARGEALPQVADPRAALDAKQILEFISALETAVQENPENSISFAELCDGMEVTIENAFFSESRAHLADNQLTDNSPFHPDSD